MIEEMLVFFGICMLHIADFVDTFMMNHFIIGVVIGLCMVGASNQRIIEVIRYNWIGAALCSVVISFAHYWMVQFGTSDNLSGYVGFAIGAGLISTSQAFFRNPKRKLTISFRK